MMFEMVVAADIEQRGGSRLGGRESFFAVGKNLCAEFKAFIDLALYEPSGVEKVSKVSLRHDLVTATSVEEPPAFIFLEPDGKLVPDLAHSQAAVGVSRRNLEHGKAADLGNVFGFLDKSDLCTSSMSIKP